MFKPPRADLVSSLIQAVRVRRFLGYYMHFEFIISWLCTNYGFDTSYMQMRWWNNGKSSYAACRSVRLISNAAAILPSQLK